VHEDEPVRVHEGELQQVHKREPRRRKKSRNAVFGTVHESEPLSRFRTGRGARPQERSDPVPLGKTPSRPNSDDGARPKRSAAEKARELSVIYRKHGNDAQADRLDREVAHHERLAAGEAMARPPPPRPNGHATSPNKESDEHAPPD
jgi:hypothetical protein